MAHALHGKTFCVVGLGKSGAAAAKLLLARGASVRCFDESDKATLPAPHPHCTLVKGALPERFWEGCEAVVVSPGVPLSKPELVAAKAAGAVVYGEIELAWRLLPKGAGPLLGVTGTNGKSTTTALLGELMKQARPRTFVGGNLGTPLSSAITDAASPAFDCHVVELSSFQLEGLETAELLGAAWLNLTPDHLDRYPSHDAYGQAKARIFARQPAIGFAVVNVDDEAVLRFARRAAKVPLYGFTRRLQARPEGFAGMAFGEAGSFRFDFGGEGRLLVRSRALRGAHNLENAMAAALMAKLAGVSDSQLQAGLDGFGGLPHRLEFVREVAGVEWLNDSKATNVDSSLVALNALPGNVWLIAGGKGKGAPYTPLVDAAKGKVKGVLTVGKDAPVIAQAFAAFPVHACETIDAAVAKARGLATAGDVVLLSPACASYDQFNNFEHRGDHFKALVRAL